MKKVLIIAYYWPPSGGGGVQRWVKFSKYLPDYGWEPIVYAPEGADYPLLDPSLETEVSDRVTVIRQPIWEPRKLYQKWVGSNPQKEGDTQHQTDEVFYLDPKDRSWKQNLSLWIRGNLVIPDARRFWIRPSVQYLSGYLKDNPVEAIISTGPPHSMHLIALGLKRRLGLPWIADFRDPWTHIEFYDRLMLTGWADRRHKYLEKTVHQRADAVIKVSPSWIALDAHLNPHRHRVIPNGYDPEDFSHVAPPPSKKFVLAHLGTLAPDRNPRHLWKVLANLCQENPVFASELRVQFVGKTAPSVIQAAHAAGLKPYVEDTGYVSHESAIELMQSAQVLLLLINDSEQNALGRIPGKVFEYLAARRPILVLGPPQGDSARIVLESQAGSVAEPGDERALREEIERLFGAYQHGKLVLATSDYTQYSRPALTGKLVGILEEIIA